MPIDPISSVPAPDSCPSVALPAGAPKAQPPPMQPDRVEKSANSHSSGPSGSNRDLYNADVVRNALSSAHVAAASATAAIASAAERVGPISGELGSKAGSAVSGALRAAVPIAGEAIGAAGLMLTTQSLAGNTGEDAPNATWRQHSSAISDRAPQDAYTTYPGNRIDVGSSHTTHPAYARKGIGDSVQVTPVETSRKPLHTGHAAPDLGVLTKPTGTAIHSGNAVDQATLAKRENIVTPAHASHLTPSGTLVNADKAVIDVKHKVNGYFLNPNHVDGMHKARVFKGALGYDANNSQGLVDQIREGVQHQKATPGRPSKFGELFGVDIPVTGPNGTATVRTAWNYDPGSQIPRLVTAVVK